jgi:hypothetical protein
METITYEILAKRLNACKLFNKFPELDENWFDGLQNGSLYEAEEGYEEEMKEIYQWYLIDQSDAEYIMQHSDELVFYSEVICEFVWGVTHCGTAWSCVELEFGQKDEA